MDWHFTTDRPIYLQLKERITLQIASGGYPPGTQLPTVRELAAEAAVNPNTVQRAFTELERDGLIYAQRTAGRFVTDDAQMVAQARDELAQGLVAELLANLAALGYSPDAAAELVYKQAKES